jgi:hypothetical protein
MPSQMAARWFVPPIACLMLAMCGKQTDDTSGAAPDRDTTAVTTQVDTGTTQWDTTGAQPSDTSAMPADTGLALPTDTTVGEYPAPSDTTDYSGTGVDSTMVPDEVGPSTHGLPDSAPQPSTPADSGF